eukprot:CAMPEP_0184315452 /NCGR_PEP_ID=MMETSP1049-20130417/82556_1 /TAXON_ID=77928 /ORGANISM="Proteomonas sulcata, Strain CCMP704" /LENGTH=193 /DNA_ID=CAMNT_0026633945 /DNA_START=30 /DNA_END=611 /DNA_ORIENTATION=+
MDWGPLIVPNTIKAPPLKKQRALRNRKQRFYALTCSQRKARGVLKNLKEERTRMFDYCMPYIFLPHKQEEETYETCVDVMCELPGRQAPLVFDFDWDMDEVDEIVKEKQEEESLSDEDAKMVEDAIRAAVKAAKQKIKEEKAKKQNVLNEMSDEHKTALKRLKLLKFYPKNELCQQYKSKYINRYYGQADQVL